MGTYYWGSFSYSLCGQDTILMTMEWETTPVHYIVK